MFIIVLDWILITHLAKHGGLDPLVTGFELFCTHGTWKNSESPDELEVVLFCVKVLHILFFL